LVDHFGANDGKIGGGNVERRLSRPTVALTGVRMDAEEHGLAALKEHLQPAAKILAFDDEIW
jgi:hypothetical protein